MLASVQSGTLCRLAKLLCNAHFPEDQEGCAAHRFFVEGFMASLPCSLHPHWHQACNLATEHAKLGAPLLPPLVKQTEHQAYAAMPLGIIDTFNDPYLGGGIDGVDAIAKAAVECSSCQARATLAAHTPRVLETGACNRPGLAAPPHSSGSCTSILAVLIPSGGQPAMRMGLWEAAASSRKRQRSAGEKPPILQRPVASPARGIDMLRMSQMTLAPQRALTVQEVRACSRCSIGHSTGDDNSDLTPCSEDLFDDEDDNSHCWRGLRQHEATKGESTRCCADSMREGKELANPSSHGYRF